MSAPAAASAPTAVPSLVPFSGMAIPSGSKTTADETTITFQIFKEESGGQPLWIESQIVTIDPAGHFQVQLGATNPNGLPSNLFSTGEARWLEVQIAGENPQSRILLASVPYALKAGDATTLGGLPVSAFALADAGIAPVEAGRQIEVPDVTGATEVTTIGGLANHVAKFSGTDTIVDSLIYDNGTDVGIGTTSPAATLDVHGTVYLRGNTSIYNITTATDTADSNSNDLIFLTSVYYSPGGKAVKPFLEWQAEPTGNTTGSPAATLNLLTSNGLSAATETGFHFNPNGTLTFAPGQTFPGTGDGTITGVTAGTDLTGGGASGNVTLKLDTTKVPTLAANNFFTGSEKFSGLATFNDGFTANQPSSIFTSSTGLEVYSSSSGSIYGQLDDTGNQYGWAIEGAAYNAYSGVYGYGDDKSQAGVIGSGNIGVYALTDLHGSNGKPEGATTLTAAVYAQAGTISNTGMGSTAFPAAVFADGGAASDSVESQTAIVGVTDSGIAAQFYNNTDDQSTLDIGNGGTGYLFIASTAQGSCAIDNNADLTCSGTISGSNVTADQRTLTTYGVQAAENWYEDYGSGQLRDGSAQISLDADFGQTVNTVAEYHVFLTPNGDCKGLYVTNKTQNGFEVRELGGGTTSVSFDYKIVAKRRGYERVRLQDVTQQVRKQTEERLKHHAANTHPASRPEIPPVPQRAQLRPISHP